MEIENREWPVLIISGQFDAQNDEGYRLRQLTEQLEEIQDCRVIPSYTYEDGYKIFRSRADFGCIVVDWDIPDEDPAETTTAKELILKMRKRHRGIPIILLTGRAGMDLIPTEILRDINDCLWKTSETISFMAGRIETHVVDYVRTVYPPFFGAMVQYSNEYKFAWHTPGHMGGEGFLRSPAGVALFKFFGESVFRSDLSVSVPELGSLLEHSGVVGDAEKNSARVFGADQTYYVLNGTSNVNQVIWRSQLVRDDIAFVDRNCHKSLNYSMVITDAYSVYMIPRRNKRGIIGPVRLSEFSPESIQKKSGKTPSFPMGSRGTR